MNKLCFILHVSTLTSGYEAWNVPQKLRSSSIEVSSKPLYSPGLTAILAKAVMNIIRWVMNIISCLFTIILYIVGFGLHAVGTCEVKCS